jgi:GlcNAc-PI de-N-acetylase
MATLVSFHAHPDAESIRCGGTLAKASEDGHRVVVVTATRGEHGHPPDGLLQPGSSSGSDGWRRAGRPVASWVCTVGSFWATLTPG